MFNSYLLAPCIRDPLYLSSHLINLEGEHVDEGDRASGWESDMIALVYVKIGELYG